MRRHIDKHLVGALCICIVIAASFAMSAFIFDRSPAPVEAAAQTVVAQPYAEGSFTGWTGYPKATFGYANIDETGACNTTDYNRTDSPAVTGSQQSAESYRVRLSSIPNSKTVLASDGTGNLIRTTYRVTKIEVMPCFATSLPSPSNANINVFFRYAQDANSRMLESSSTSYTVTSNLFQTLATSTWSTDLKKFADSALEIGVRYMAGNGGANVSQLKVRVTYDSAVETIPGPASVPSPNKPTVTRQPLPSNTLKNADLDLSTFKLSTAASGTSSVKRIIFRISKNAGVNIKNFRVKKNGIDMPLSAYDVTYATTSNASVAVESGSTGSTSGTGYIALSFTKDELITGVGAIYTLHATVFGVTPGSFITTSFYGKSTVPPPDADNAAMDSSTAGLSFVPPPDADLSATGNFFWAETRRTY